MSETVLILNPKSGTNQSQSTCADAVEATLREAYSNLRVCRLRRKTVPEQIRAVCLDPNVSRLFVAGGDGTVSAAANALAGQHATLGIIPTGTMNLTARALGIPLDPVKAASALAGGATEMMDLGKAGDRYFIHHVSFGVYPRLIRLRDRVDTSSRLRKIWATIRSLPMAIRDPKPMHWRIGIEGDVRDEQTPALIVSNNIFGAGHLPYTNEMTGGELGLYIATSSTWPDLALAAAAVMTGQAHTHQGIGVLSAPELILELVGNNRGRVRAAIDGELTSLPARTELCICKRALRVLRPANIQR